MKKQDLVKVFGTKRPILGMLHVPPLPGSPNYKGSMTAVIEHVLQDAETLSKNGIDAMIVENLGDYPYYPYTQEPETISAMTRVTLEVRRRYDLPLGVQVLRNSWKSSLAIASICDCQFIRLNVLTDALVTDQGIVNGAAHLALRYRKMIDAENVLIFSDIYSKHAGPIVERDLATVAHEMVHRGMADAIIVSHGESSIAAPKEKIEKVANAVPDTPIFLGSGITLKTYELLKYVDGSVFGYGTKPSGNMDDPVDGPTVKEFMEKVKALD